MKNGPTSRSVLDPHHLAKEIRLLMFIHHKHIMDERYAAIDVAGKGLIIFSA